MTTDFCIAGCGYMTTFSIGCLSRLTGKAFSHWALNQGCTLGLRFVKNR